MPENDAAPVVSKKYDRISMRRWESRDGEE